MKPVVVEAGPEEAVKLLTDREKYPKACLVGPRRIGKTTLLRKVGAERKVFTDAYRVIADYLFLGRYEELVRELGEYEVIELSPWQYEWLKNYPAPGEWREKILEALEPYMSNVVLLKIEERVDPEIGELEKYGYEFLGERRETYHPDLTEWHKRLLRTPTRETIEESVDLVDKIRGVLETTVGALKKLITSETAKELAEVLGLVGLPISLAVKVASLGLALTQPEVDLTKERLIRLHSLHPAELEKWEKELKLEPGTLETIKEAPRRAHLLTEKMAQLTREWEASIKELREEVRGIEHDIRRLLGLVEKTLEELLPYRIVTSPEELREYLRVPPDEEIVVPTHGWYRDYMKRVVEKAGEGVVGIVAPPGCGKTVLLYILCRELLSQGVPIAVIDESKLKGLGLSRTHIEEGIILVIDDLSDSETFEKLMDSPNAKQVIYTARAMVHENLLNTYTQKKQGKKPERLIEKPLTPPPEAARHLVLQILGLYKVRIKPRNIDELMKRLKTTYKKYESTLIYYASLLARENKGGTLNPYELPPFADYLVEVLSRRLRAAGLVDVNLDPLPGREEDLAATIYTLALIALMEGELREREAREFYRELVKVLRVDNPSYAYRRMACPYGSRIGYEHFTWTLLLTPNPHHWPETAELVRGAERIGDLNKLYRAAVDVVLKLVGDYVEEEFGISLEELADTEHAPNTHLVVATLPPLLIRLRVKAADKASQKILKHLVKDMAKQLSPFSTTLGKARLTNYAYYKPLLPPQILQGNLEEAVDALADALTKQRIAEAAEPLGWIAIKLGRGIGVRELSGVSCLGLPLDVYAVLVRLGYRGGCGGFKGLLERVADEVEFRLFPAVVLGRL